MLLGETSIQIILMAGGTIPLPVSSVVTAALTSVEVTNDAEQGDGFQMSFTLGKEVTEYSLLADGSLDTFNRVIVGVLLGAVPEVLIDGIITHHQMTPSNEPGQSTLTVTGKDVSLMLDLEEKNQSYPNMPDFLIVTQLLASYAQFGLVPMITPTTDVPIIIDRIPRQQETDFKFIKRMADRNGFTFYIEPLTFGANTAYWGPETRIGLPQPALSINMGHDTNTTSLHFSNDALAPVATSGTVLEPITKSAIPIPSLPSLRIPPLVTSPAQARRTVLLRETANQNPATAATSSIASVTNAPDAVSGEGELDAIRYGNVLRARKLVGVRGAGQSYDGNYYVRRVTHDVKIGSYKQKFTLSREGTGALLPVVVP